MSLVFCCFSPHPPILLPSVGPEEEREKVKKTIASLKKLKKGLKEAGSDYLIISSPHLEWGFDVPLYFLGEGNRVKKYLIGSKSPTFYFNQGRNILLKKKTALIGSGDLSHRLKEDGPYGFHSDGPEFDQELITSLKKKDVKNILTLNEKYPEAGECGLRSFSFILGILENSGEKWQPKILSYQDLFGVGYLVVNFEIKR